MDDGQWRLRLVYALLRSRYVIAVVDADHDIAARDWVRVELSSALEAEALAGVERVLVATQSDGARIPVQLSTQARYAISADTDRFAALIKSGDSLLKDPF